MTILDILGINVDAGNGIDGQEFFGMIIAACAENAQKREAASRTSAEMSAKGFTGNSSKLTTNLTGDFAGFAVVFHGSGLGTNAKGVPNAGMVEWIEVVHKSTGQKAVVTLEIQRAAADLISSAGLGSGSPRADHYEDLMDLLVPNFMIATGNKQDNVFQGSKGADEISAKGGNDKLYLWKGDDKFDGGKGRDSVDASWQNKAINANLIKGWVKYGTDEAKLARVENVTGSRKDDTITGNSAANVLAGRKGNDKLTGKGGNDKFVFKPNEGTNVITDFQNGKDKLDLKGFKFKSKAAALKHFSEVGSSNDDICKFVFDGTIVKIKGVDLKNIDATDIVI